MLFFYTGIGFAMFTTVLAMLQTSAALNKNQFLDKIIKIDADKILLRKKNDTKFIQLFAELGSRSLGSGQMICSNLKTGFTDISDPNYSILNKYSTLNSYTQIEVNSLNSRLISGCGLNHKNHRVVIVPNSDESMKYNFFSCIIETSYVCKFEDID